MTWPDLARRLSDAALAHRITPDESSRAHLESLIREAVDHVDRVGQGTVDHIVLTSVLRRIAADTPLVARVLQDGGWRWAQ
jgi:hypothetical protein